jgi:hypothetical protein
MTTYILVADVNRVDRRDLERIENQVFDSKDDIRKEVDVLYLYRLTDFMEDVNDGSLPDFSDKWIGYAHVKNRKP